MRPPGGPYVPCAGCGERFYLGHGPWTAERLLDAGWVTVKWGQWLCPYCPAPTEPHRGGARA